MPQFTRCSACQSQTYFHSLGITSFQHIWTIPVYVSGGNSYEHLIVNWKITLDECQRMASYETESIQIWKGVQVPTKLCRKSISYTQEGKSKRTPLFPLRTKLSMNSKGKTSCLLWVFIRIAELILLAAARWVWSPKKFSYSILSICAAQIKSLSFLLKLQF